jgi:hypothetical protein
MKTKLFRLERKKSFTRKTVLLLWFLPSQQPRWELFWTPCGRYLNLSNKWLKIMYRIAMRYNDSQPVETVNTRFEEENGCDLSSSSEFSLIFVRSLYFHLHSPYTMKRVWIAHCKIICFCLLWKVWLSLVPVERVLKENSQLGWLQYQKIHSLIKKSC